MFCNFINIFKKQPLDTSQYSLTKSTSVFHLGTSNKSQKFTTYLVRKPAVPY